MRRICFILASLTVLSECIASAQIRAEDLQKLDGMLDGYVTAISAEDIDSKNAEVDFIIDTSRDSVLRDHVACKLFAYYSEAPVMGDEAVAIHIYDRWFATGEASFADQAEASLALMFVRFNRSTLLGAKAPELHLRGLLDEDVVLPDGNGSSLVFFYDIYCPKCKVETILLRNFLRDAGKGLTLFAVYVGDDREAWEKYCNGQFDVITDSVKVIHVWDPDGVSDFQYLYGVTRTPRMFLIEDGTVIGRRLDTESLMQLLPVRKAQAELDARAPVGSRIADLKLPGTRMNGGREKKGVWRLSRMDRVIFYVPGCANCTQTLEKVRNSSGPADGRALLVDLDGLSATDPELARTVFDTFDLTVLPLTLILKNGLIIEKIR